MSTKTYEVQWNPLEISKLLRRNKIHGRGDLSERIGISRSSVYATFNADWSGKASTAVLAQLVGLLGANPGRVIQVVRK
ncbi:Cro protein [Mycobacterium phage Boilgate]|nr:Cro protein [Mycobacterium phage Boilgate]